MITCMTIPPCCARGDNNVCFYQVLSASNPELLAAALKSPTDEAILKVALTLSSPELLAVALQDATKENLQVALSFES